MNESTRTPRSGRASIVVAALLVVCTLALGAAFHPTHPGDERPPPVHAAGDGPVTLSARLDRTAVLGGGDGVVRLELALAASGQLGRETVARPTDLVVILDRSGSMNGRKLDDVRAAVHQLVAQLSPEDRFALVTFASGARMEIPLGHVTAAVRPHWHHTVDGIHAGGGTHMARGLDLGLGALEASRAAGRVPRALLISDGLAAEPADALWPRARRAVSGEYTLSTVGVGREFDEQLLSSLADAGTGNYHYLEDPGALSQVLAAEFETARETLASAVAVTLRPGRGVEVLHAAGYPLERGDGAVTFRPGSLFAGQERRVWVTYRVPVRPGATSDVGAVRVEYRHAGQRRRLDVGDLPRVAAVADEERFLAKLDRDAWADGTVVDRYNALRQRVAALVLEGDSAGARDEIRSYQRDAGALNAAVASPQVADRIDAAVALEAEVDEAFRSPEPAAARNRLGKKLLADGIRGRRVGSRK